MRVPLVAGNWKMNGNLHSARTLAEAVDQGVRGGGGAEAAVCPPFVYLNAVAESLADGAVRMGAQNLSEQASGAFTGEISGAMLQDLGCSYVIIGHSERRRIYGETDALVAEKFETARKFSLSPIVCIGETLAEREAGQIEEIVARQLNTVIDLNSLEHFRNAIIAYEPVWAIGTGKTASPEQAQVVHAFVRELVAKRDTGIAEELRILYGGSVTADNAAGLFAQDDIDGALVGGASLDAESFLKIFRAAVAGAG